MSLIRFDQRVPGERT